jgi:threonine dehydrogenase-like Zn-dependent dehydrogenase
MRALTYQGAHDVRIQEVPEPRLEDPDDIIVKVTATAICGSDLHLFRGKLPGLERGDILGHEFMGVVEDAGADVVAVSIGDRVVVPFVIACGSCFFCERELYAACETTNVPPHGDGHGAIANRKGVKPGAALFGYTHLYGGVPGGQAEHVRVPKANTGPLVVPMRLDDEQVLFLSDILPTAYQAVTNAEVVKGSTLVIFGAGPVGLLTAACARMIGARTIFMVDHHDYRLNFAAATYDVIPINFDKTEDPAEDIIRSTHQRGVDAAIDAVGFEAKGSLPETLMTNLKLEGSSGKVLRWAIAATRRGGLISVPGVYAGYIHAFLFGDAFEKGVAFRMGQTHVHKYMPELLQYIEAGALRPEQIISHRLPLDEAVHGYEVFNKRLEDCRKVVLYPT